MPNEAPAANFKSSVPEGLVDGPVPADKGHRGEEDEPEDGQTKVDSICSTCSEIGQAGQDVEEQRGAVDWSNRKPISSAHNH